MKAYVKAIVKMLNDYTDRQERINYLNDEIKSYRKVLETLESLETSDANNEIISKVKDEIMKDETFIVIYTDECNEMVDNVADRYDSEISYSQIWREDVACMEKTMRNNVMADMSAGYSIAKIKDELDEIEKYRDTMEKRYNELTSSPNSNVAFFADLVNRGVCGL